MTDSGKSTHAVWGSDELLGLRAVESIESITEDIELLVVKECDLSPELVEQIRGKATWLRILVCCEQVAIPPMVLDCAPDGIAIGEAHLEFLLARLADGTYSRRVLEERKALLQDKADQDQRLASLQRYVDFFEQASDGIVVTTPDGIIRYANDSAAETLQSSSDELHGKSFIALLSPQYHRLAKRVLASEESAGSVGGSYGYIDFLLPIGHTDTVISAAIRHLADSNRVLVSFRDVTELREIENELRQTKDFLENLIQSSVDAIVAADVEGKVILFNSAAAQMLGFSAREVVSRLRFNDLLAPDELSDAMGKLSSSGFGGRGRLSLIRTDLLSKSGEKVPVNMTASTIYEGDREVAVVGIFTDLRERMRIEEKLNQAQLKLQISERQEVAMELAGLAAHELNQPMTSILGYAEILKRRMPDDERALKPVTVILREVERMAGIVRRLGHITDYKSQAYVGGARILELENSQSPQEEAATDKTKEQANEK